MLNVLSATSCCSYFLSQLSILASSDLKLEFHLLQQWPEAHSQDTAGVSLRWVSDCPWLAQPKPRPKPHRVDQLVSQSWKGYVFCHRGNMFQPVLPFYFFTPTITISHHQPFFTLCYSSQRRILPIGTEVPWILSAYPAKYLSVFMVAWRSTNRVVRKGFPLFSDSIV